MCPEKSEPQTYCTDKCKHAPYWTKLSMHSPRSITVWTVVQAVLTATFNSYGDRQISTAYKINTPEPIDKQFSTVDYVREGTLYTKFDTNPLTGGFWANGWNITKNIFYLYLIFSVTRTEACSVAKRPPSLACILASTAAERCAEGKWRTVMSLWVNCWPQAGQWPVYWSR